MKLHSVVTTFSPFAGTATRKEAGLRVQLRVVRPRTVVYARELELFQVNGNPHVYISNSEAKALRCHRAVPRARRGLPELRRPRRHQRPVVERAHGPRRRRGPHRACGARPQ